MSKIDVSKCEHYNFGECNKYDFSFSCINCSNCYYKQLQKLKATIDEIEEICRCCSEITFCFDCKYHDYCKNELQDYILQRIKKIKEVKGNE